MDSRLRSLGIAKIGQRCRIALALQSRAAAPSSTPQAAGLRVAVVCNSSYFAGASYGGAVRASLALLREIRRICGSAGSSTLDIFAILPKPVPAALAFKLGPGRVGVLEWGEEQVWVKWALARRWPGAGSGLSAVRAHVVAEGGADGRHAGTCSAAHGRGAQR